MLGEQATNPEATSQERQCVATEIDPGQWMAPDGLGGAVFAPSADECYRIIRDRNGEA